MLSEIVVLISLQTILATQNVRVVTPSGEVLGSTLTTRLGKIIYSFRGIRYAQPPINELRFQPPVPVDQWSGIYNATEDGPVCPQPTKIDPVSEDCLLLNVYTTKLPESKQHPRRPVIIYLHAGGFYSGTGRSNWIGPQYLLDQDIVLVTINYRLGSLGFISLGEEAPGNNGFKDQVVAMKWVKKNIAAFGGDPNSVTLHGYSAGAWSITLHMVSPMSRGLFHKAIISSGSTLGQIPISSNQVELAKKQARLLGCPDNSSKEILNCLKTKPAEDFGNSLPEFAEFHYDPIVIWYAVVEEDFGQERFLTDHPVKLIANRNFQKVPVLTGITKDEFGDLGFWLAQNKTALQALSDNFEKYAPICFCYERNTEKSKEVSKAIRKFYLDDKPLSNDSIPALAKVYADSIIGFPVHSGANLLSEKSTESVYYYDVTYQGRYSHSILPGTNTPYGVVHHDDLIYLYFISPLFPLFNQSYPESRMVDILTGIWANFAQNGTPVPKSNEHFEGITWEPYNTSTKSYMEIGEKLLLKKKLHEDRYAFWRHLYPLSSFI